MIAERLRSECERLGLPFEASWVPPITAHLELLQRWAPRVNITTVADPVEAVTRHMVDSLAVMLLDAVRSRSGMAVDVGSGGGFPGLVLAVALQDLQWTLLEPRGKRGSFLTQVIARAGLKNAAWKRGRLPDASLNGLFQVVVSRATFPPDELLGRVAPLLASDGVAVMMTAEAPPPPHKGFVEVERHEFSLDGAPRFVTAFGMTSS